MDTPQQLNGDKHRNREWVFVRRFWHWRAHRWIYRKNGGFFRFRRY
jgi:hypothetical protein